METTTRKLRRARKWAFAMGAISVVSWYTVFVLGVLRGVDFSLKNYLVTYGVMLAVGLIGSQIMERVMGSRPMPSVDSESAKS